MKKGFTLVEVLGVMVVLGIIGAIVTPVVQNSINESATKSCEIQIKLFEKAARNYTSQNPYKTYTSVTLRELQDGGFLKSGEIKNPKGGNFDLDSVIDITKDASGNYLYSYNFDCLSNNEPTYSNACDLKNKVKVVTSGDGLYRDTIENGRYIYKGANPNNYIYIRENGVNIKYRIYSIEDDCSLKVVRKDAIVNMPFDVNDATRRKGGYCDSSRCNAWAATNHFINGTKSGVVSGLNGNTGDSSIKEYIDNNFAPTLDIYDKLVSKLWNVSGTSDDNIATSIADEKTTRWNGKIALLTASEYVRANSNISLCGSLSNLKENAVACRVDNYLYDGKSTCLLTPYKLITWQNLIATFYGDVNNYLVDTSWDFHPAFYLPSDVLISGSGTDSNPYVLLDN